MLLCCEQWQCVIRVEHVCICMMVRLSWNALWNSLDALSPVVYDVDSRRAWLVDKDMWLVLRSVSQTLGFGPPAAVLRASAVRVICFVVHDQLVVHEIEAVGLRLVGMQGHLTDWNEEQKYIRQLKCPYLFLSNRHGAYVLHYERRHLKVLVNCYCTIYEEQYNNMAYCSLNS